jgi:RNA polymerase sigma-70 factor (ECF subfamily)
MERMISPARPTSPATSALCEELLHARVDRIRALAVRLLGQDADDGMQEVFAAACRSLPGFRGEARLSTWFHRLAIRVLCACRTRRDGRAARERSEPEVEPALSSAAVRAFRDAPFLRLGAAERADRVQQALARLSPPLREVLLLRGEGLAYDEIASALAIPLGTVKSRMSKALVALAERLPPREELLP